MIYIDFAFLVVAFLRSNQCYAMFRVQWSAVGREFDEVISQLRDAKIEFDAEVNLASC
ncbi:hypothetical protein B0H63DRAFT_484066 [Podospora didyma]|uniref:Uncharacterized protein n=1 Tax=Podospora didyma TaxID=330526 RepID=A0AAE0K8Q9_9PEZI|nr:hypothetical protein B0H63DRAFT_484066 [Podospora didyma]